MSERNRYIVLALLAAAALVLAGCGDFGEVQQGRVIAYNQKTGEVTLIRDSSEGQAAKPVYDGLPALTVKTPADPEEMGPAPQAGKLMRVDPKKHELVIYDAAAEAFRTIQYTPIAERQKVAKGTGLPVIDKVKQTITVYCAAEHTAITFRASDEWLALPADTWKTGDEVRYYFKDPAQALRMMNISKTDLSKS